LSFENSVERLDRLRPSFSAIPFNHVPLLRVSPPVSEPAFALVTDFCDAVAHKKNGTTPVAKRDFAENNSWSQYQTKP
ncbi:MAG TPA: hypothetical protein VK934_11245, partial [Fimbriimonas sp.]|nr:hypothetical protein [Fimbriimonas sp.]